MDHMCLSSSSFWPGWLVRGSNLLASGSNVSQFVMRETIGFHAPETFTVATEGRKLFQADVISDQPTGILLLDSSEF